MSLLSCSVPDSVPEAQSAPSDPFEQPPERRPVLFAKDLISTDLDERDIALAPEGRQIIFTLL